MHGTARIQKPRKKSAKAFWMKQLHTWHWVSSAISLIGLLLFAFTGITLNHAADVEASPQTIEKSATLPADLLKQVAAYDAPDAKKPLPAPVAAWVEKSVGQSGQGVAEWSADEIYLALPRPGGDGWVSIDRHDGKVSSESTSRGWISFLTAASCGVSASTEAVASAIPRTTDNLSNFIISSTFFYRRRQWLAHCMGHEAPF